MDERPQTTSEPQSKVQESSSPLADRRGGTRSEHYTPTVSAGTSPSKLSTVSHADVSSLSRGSSIVSASSINDQEYYAIDKSIAAFNKQGDHGTIVEAENCDDEVDCDDAVFTEAEIESLFRLAQDHLVKLDRI